MAYSPNPKSPSLARDPYELERLAEELETRESIHPRAYAQQPKDEDETDLHELPVYIPLSHDNKYLTTEDFNVEEFLLSRSHTSLPDLRSELRDYLSVLKEELVKLINDDYEAFISLSTDLKDEGARLERLKRPLGGLKSQVLESRKELQLIQNAIQEKLKQRSILRERESLLHLLLKISESITRLESLLLITLPEQDGLKESKIPSQLSGIDEQPDEKGRGGRAKHLARVAVEYTQLLYHTSKARAEKCVFVDEVQWQIDRIQSTLSSDLDHLFATILSTLTDTKGDSRASELERAKCIADLTECLRTYDLLGLWRDAEDVLRREVVRGFIKKTVYPGALAAPHSPIIPHTPFHPSEPLATGAFHPRTPYTPFTAFVSKNDQQNHPNLGSTSELPQAHLLQDSDDPLSKLYNQLLRFIEQDLSRIMDVAEKVSVKAVARPGDKDGALPSAIEESRAGGRGFQIMANVVWDEIGKAIMDEIGSVVFAVGRPNDFRKNYETTQAFIQSLELMAPTANAIETMRSHPIYTAFEQSWQLPVYFQLRWKEIIGKLENSLSVTRLEMSLKAESDPFATSEAHAVWTAICTCWSAEVYIPDLCPRFWRLTLQILNRYRSWIDECLARIDYIPKVSAGLGIDKTTNSPQSRSSTPIPSAAEDPSAEAAAIEDATLRQYAAAIIDIQAMRSKMKTIWDQEISMLLPEVGPDFIKAEEALDSVLSKLTALIPSMSSQIITILTRRCCVTLAPVKSIPTQFRAMSNKRNPTEASYFVSSILRPVKQFFAIGTSGGPGSRLGTDFLDVYSTEIFNSVTQRYISYLVGMKKTEESLKRLKKGKKTPFSLFGSAAAKDEEGKDEERIRTQMILDAEAFGKDAQSLGIKTDTNEAFQALIEMVNANDGVYGISSIKASR
ncbi:COG complex component [Crucibulum laeve]|uniref:Conserved oligomeric Golgi complex subunit 2 n=1 Tax=Crucibulum laeve TaxID=68775 RepID=A0A5C3MTM6_9AGAR|nr:COG complex component [Crucibulum laeve]